MVFFLLVWKRPILLSQFLYFLLFANIFSPFSIQISKIKIAASLSQLNDFLSQKILGRASRVYEMMHPGRGCDGRKNICGDINLYIFFYTSNKCVCVCVCGDASNKKFFFLLRARSSIRHINLISDGHFLSARAFERRKNRHVYAR